MFVVALSQSSKMQKMLLFLYNIAKNVNAYKTTYRYSYWRLKRFIVEIRLRSSSGAVLKNLCQHNGYHRVILEFFRKLVLLTEL